MSAFHPSAKLIAKFLGDTGVSLAEFNRLTGNSLVDTLLDIRYGLPFRIRGRRVVFICSDAMQWYKAQLAKQGTQEQSDQLITNDQNASAALSIACSAINQKRTPKTDGKGQQVGGGR